jgi:futalosine hydrolase
MRVLIVSATPMEVAPLVAAMKHIAGTARLSNYSYAGHNVDVLTTGVGMVATAAWCASTLNAVAGRYDVAINCGACGSFDETLPPGTVVHVVTDCLSELGAEDGDAFLSLQELQLPGECQLTNSDPPENRALSILPRVRGITVNTAHGNDASIATARQRFGPQVESMEGAAFMFACQIHRVPFAQVRAVSNVVERRNRERWEMRRAIENLARTGLAILEGA